MSDLASLMTGFVGTFCTLGKQPETGLEYHTVGVNFCEKFNQYAVSLGLGRTTSTKIYACLMSLPLAHPITRGIPSTMGVKLCGIIMNEDIPRFRSRPTYATQEERNKGRQEVQRRYRLAHPKKDKEGTQGSIPKGSYNSHARSLPLVSSQSTKLEFAWDGTDLGLVAQSRITIYYISPKTGITYWRINGDVVDVVVVLTPIKNSNVSIVDELKVLFGLPKLGTHRCRLADKQQYAMIRSTVMNGIVIEELPYGSITLLSHPESLTRSIQRTIAFRELIGIKSTTEDDLLLRQEMDGSLYVAGSNEKRLCKTATRNVTSKTLCGKWFSKETILSTVDRAIYSFWFRSRTQEEFRERIRDLERAIADIIARVDPVRYELTDQLVTRMWSKGLCFMLKN